MKIVTLLAPIRSGYTRNNKNELDKTDDSNISDGKIDNKIANLSKSTKKMSFEAGFLAFKASLAFI